MEEEIKQETIEIPPQPPDRAVEKAHNARKARERTARLRALGLNARGVPLKDRHKNRDNAKQKKYQANFAARHKAARERLGLTISEFNKLPHATRMLEYNKLKEGGDRKAQQRSWYHRNKDKVLAARRAKTTGAKESVTEHISECPVCGCNLDRIRAIRLAVKFAEDRKNGGV